MAANLTPSVCVRIFVVMLPFAALGAGIMTLVASCTRSFREAQTYTSIAMVAPPLPIEQIMADNFSWSIGPCCVSTSSQS